METKVGFTLHLLEGEHPMTDPVDTDALRMNAVEATRRGGDWGIVGKQLEAAADELDRLQDIVEAAEVLRYTQVQRVDRLLAAIDKAPHADGCWTNDVSAKRVLLQYRKCTCWKADAL